MKRALAVLFLAFGLAGGGCTYERAKELGLEGAWRDMAGPLASRLVDNRAEQRELASRMAELDDGTEERDALREQLASLIQEEQYILWRMDQQSAAAASAAAGFGAMANTLNQQQMDQRMRSMEVWQMQQQHQQRMQNPNPLLNPPPNPMVPRR